MDLAAANGTLMPILPVNIHWLQGQIKVLYLKYIVSAGWNWLAKVSAWMTCIAGKQAQHGTNPGGMYVPALGGLDVTGDGVADIAILQSKDDKAR